MAGGPAVGGAEPGEPPRLQPHQLRGQQALGDQDGAHGDLSRRLGLAGQGQQHPAFQVQQVVHPLGHPPVAQAAQGLDIAAHGGAPGEARALAGGDQPVRLGGQFGILHEAQMSGEDRLAGRSAALGHLGGERGANLAEGRRQGCALPVDTGADFGDGDLGPAQMGRAAHGQAGRSHDALDRTGRRGARRHGEGRRLGGQGRALSHAAHDEFAQGVDGRLGAGADGDQFHLVAQLGPEGHNRHRALGVGLAGSGPQDDLGGEGLGGLGQAGGRSGVQAVSQGDREGGLGGFAGRDGERSGDAGPGAQSQERFSLHDPLVLES